MKKICQLLFPPFLIALLFWIMLGLLFRERADALWQLLGACFILINIVLFLYIVCTDKTTRVKK